MTTQRGVCQLQSQCRARFGGSDSRPANFLFNFWQNVFYRRRL